MAKTPEQRAAHLARTKKWMKENPEKTAEMRRRHRLKQYGLTLEDYDRMLEDQRGLCAVCRRSCTSGRSLAVDHDHVTGEVRGLLCIRCNKGLGYFLDNPELLHLAANYLREGVRRHGTTHVS